MIARIRRVPLSLLASVSMTVLAMGMTITPAQAKCRFSEQATIEGPGITRPVRIRQRAINSVDAPGQPLRVTPRGEEQNLSAPFYLENSCFSFEYYDDFRGRPVIQFSGRWYEPSPELARELQTQITQAQLISRVRAAGAQ